MGPDGSPPTIADLPSPGTKRWSPSSRSRGRAWRPAFLGGSLQPLYSYVRWISFLGDIDRGARPCRVTLLTHAIPPDL